MIVFVFSSLLFTYDTFSAGQVGPEASFLDSPSSPECKDTATLGRALFDSQSIDNWANLFAVNCASLFFLSTACLGLLEKATKETSDYLAVIVNITSVSGITKLSQTHVRTSIDIYLL